MTARGGTRTSFDHTADLGLAVEAPDLDALFETAAEALFDAIVGLDAIVAREEVVIETEGAVDDADLLVRFLSELLFLHDARDWLFGEFRVERRGPGRLRAVARGERLDPQRHAIARQVKAVTYHGLKLERHDGGFRARLVLDL